MVRFCDTTLWMGTMFILCWCMALLIIKIVEDVKEMITEWQKDRR
jgi:hypothetical protein